jgi:class 3 adenylate cyclase
VDPSRNGGGGLTATGLFCGSCGIELPPNSKFCNECGTPLTHATRAAEYKQVTVLFADVVHSMDIAVGSERLREIMAQLLGRAKEVVQRYEGTLATPADEGLVIRDIWLLRLRALLARAHGDAAAYAHLREPLPRHGENSCLRWAYRVGRGDAITAVEPQ